MRGALNAVKNNCEGVHLIVVKLPAISLQACKFKMNFFTLQGFQLDFKLLIIVLFLGIISRKSASRFNGGRGPCFSNWGEA